jgi:organic hydroperoxide reductase OsmC/OhrA
MAAGSDDEGLDRRNHFVRAPNDTDGSKHVNQLRKILYAAQASVEGGREGSGRTACFQSSPLRIASGRKLDLGPSAITSHVSIGPDAEGPFGLAVTLDLDAPQLDRPRAADLIARAHELGPYSRATRGNISVELMVGGQAIAETAGVA